MADIFDRLLPELQKHVVINAPIGVFYTLIRVCKKWNRLLTSDRKFYNKIKYMFSNKLYRNIWGCLWIVNKYRDTQFFLYLYNTVKENKFLFHHQLDDIYKELLAKLLHRDGKFVQHKKSAILGISNRVLSIIDDDVEEYKKSVRNNLMRDYEQDCYTALIFRCFRVASYLLFEKLPTGVSKRNQKLEYLRVAYYVFSDDAYLHLVKRLCKERRTDVQKYLNEFLIHLSKVEISANHCIYLMEEFNIDIDSLKLKKEKQQIIEIILKRKIKTKDTLCLVIQNMSHYMSTSMDRLIYHIEYLKLFTVREIRDVILSVGSDSFTFFGVCLLQYFLDLNEIGNIYVRWSNQTGKGVPLNEESTPYLANWFRKMNELRKMDLSTIRKNNSIFALLPSADPIQDILYSGHINTIKDIQQLLNLPGAQNIIVNHCQRLLSAGGCQLYLGMILGITRIREEVIKKEITSPVTLFWNIDLYLRLYGSKIIPSLVPILAKRQSSQYMTYLLANLEEFIKSEESNLLGDNKIEIIANRIEKETVEEIKATLPLTNVRNEFNKRKRE